MQINSLSAKRRNTRQVRVGNVLIGGSAAIVVQSMTNTDTVDIDATVKQVAALAKAGSELVRITVNSPQAAAAVAPIRERLDALNCRVPLIGDFHYNGHRLLTQYPECDGAGEISHQSRQRRPGQQARCTVCDHDRSRM